MFGHERALKTLRAALGRGRVHHAYLFAGPEGVGKEMCARIFAQALNCERGDNDACGACGQCRKIAHGNHPDVLAVMPEAEAVSRRLLTKGDIEGTPSRDIRVEQIRTLRARLSLRPVEAKWRVVVLVAADRMNATAQNVLLKTLEEPPPRTTLILISAAPDALLSTIRSRCARVLFGPLAVEIVAREVAARTKLGAEDAALAARVAQGSLGGALSLDAKDLAGRRALLTRAAQVQDVAQAVQMADGFSEREAAEELVDALKLFWRDVAALASGAGPETQVWTDLADLAGARAQELGGRGALARADACTRAREGLSREHNGNPRLMLERMFLETL